MTTVTELMFIAAEEAAPKIRIDRAVLERIYRAMRAAERPRPEGALVSGPTIGFDRREADPSRSAQSGKVGE